MNNRELEKIIKNDAEKSTPNIWPNIEEDVQNNRGEVVTVTPQKKKSRVLSFVSSVAAALVLISAAVFGITNYNRADLKPVSTVYLEVNPQIELSLNTYNTVLEARTKNEDGQKVLGTMELKGSQLEVALNAILGSMLKNGYLTNDANSVLISIENDDKIKSNQLREDVLKSVNSTIDNEFKVAAVVQNANYTDALKSTADSLHITSGKAEFIEFMQQNGVKASKEELSKLSVHELNLIFQSLKIHDDFEPGKNDPNSGMGYKGTAVSNKYIDIARVEDIVFKDVKLSKNDVRDFETDLDFENGKMIYEVEFEVGGKEYEYSLDAVSGEILVSNNKGFNPKPEVSSSPEVSSKPTISSEPSNTSSNKIDAIIAPEEALKIALSHAGLATSNVTDVEVEFDDDNAVYHYDVDFYYGGYDYEYEIDAISGKVLKNHKEFDD